MPTVSTPFRQGPSLRIEELAITNFRTFRERTVIPFRGEALEADAIATFHGDNGSGKSNAIAALAKFFETSTVCLRKGELTLAWDNIHPIDGQPFCIPYRDRPTGADGPTVIEVRFADARLGTLRTVLAPSGKNVRVQLERFEDVGVPDGGSPQPGFNPLLNKEVRDSFLTSLESPFGPSSNPISILNARRRASWQWSPEKGSLLPSGLAEELLRRRTALHPELRESWRGFVKVLERFAVFAEKEVSIDRLAADTPPELILEERGRSVLRLGELSSGEQQIMVICAAILLSNAAIFVLEEPELSLDHKNQRLLQEILQEQVDAGRIDQVILESHVAAFDGPSVIRFRRGPAGNTEVTREPSAGEAQREIASQAKAHGAKQRWVTREGYTQLPENMREDLRLDTGGHVWFLKNQSRWEAWPEDELAKFLSDDEPEKRVLSCD